MTEQEPATGHHGPAVPVRNVLFLQGLATPYFRLLAEKLKAAGHTVHRLNYCPGDWLFGPLSGGFRGECTSYRGRQKDLPAFYRRLFAARGVDTILLFGDCRPVHVDAITVAAEMGIRVMAFEEGYTRPGWITLEEDGTNYFSRLPRLPEGIRALAQGAQPAPDLPVVGTDMFRRSWMDVANHAVNILGRPFYPHYRSHRPQPILKELGGWARRLVRKRRNRRLNDAVLQRYETGTERYYLVPLQLNTDYQIRIHSDFPDMPTFITTVLMSFAARAPKNTRLFFKNHPLDNGLVPYRRLITELSVSLGVTDRVDFAAGGDLGMFLDNSLGVVLVNSTVGYAALKAGRPMKVMGRALYNMHGLSDQRPLDQFWNKPQPPEHSLAQDFLNVIRTYTQIRGDFFSREGAAVAVEGAAEVIEGRRQRLPLPVAPPTPNP